MILAQRSFVKCGDWFQRISNFDYAIVCFRPSVSLKNEKRHCEISTDKMAVCETTTCLRSGNFSNLNSSCQKVLVLVKIWQFQDMLNENSFLVTFRGHGKRTMGQP